jgi:hypothetical protein
MEPPARRGRSVGKRAYRRGVRAPWVWTAAVLGLPLLHVPAGADVIEANLEMVGRSDLGGPATYGDVTVVGDVALVAIEEPGCVGSVKVVNVKDPDSPKLVAAIDLPAGTTGRELDSVRVDTPASVRDLLAVAVTPCTGGRAPAVAYYDVTDPEAPTLLAETAGALSVSLAHRGDDRIIAVRASSDGVVVDDLTDPSRPTVLGEWRQPAAAPGPCASAQSYDGGNAAVAVLAGGRAYDIDLTEPATPATAGPTETGGGHVGVLPLGNRTLAIVAEGDCSATTEPGLRVLTLERGVPPRDEVPVRYPGVHAPGRLVTSGALAYVAWHGAGLRVVDFGEVRPRAVAQFVPAAPDVVGVALLSEYVVVTDSTSGLYVLARPDEGGGPASFWSQFLSLLPYLGFAGLMAAMFLVPRALASRAAARSGAGVPSPMPAPVPRRRA